MGDAGGERDGGDDRIFANVTVGGWNLSDRYLLAASGLEAGTLRVGHAEATGLSGVNTVVKGTRLVLMGFTRNLGVLDAAELDGLELVFTKPLPTFPEHVSLSGDVAYCSLGSWGLQTVDISN